MVVQPQQTAERRGVAPAGRNRGRLLLTGAAFAAFAVLCGVALGFPLLRIEPDDFAYNDTLIAMVHGHFLSLSVPQLQALAPHLPHSSQSPLPIPPDVAARMPGLQAPAGTVQWVQLRDGRWISEKDPGYPCGSRCGRR